MVKSGKPPMYPLYILALKSGPWISTIGFIWDFVRHANLGHHPKLSGSNLHFNKFSIHLPMKVWEALFFVQNQALHLRKSFVLQKDGAFAFLESGSGIKGPVFL